MWPIHHVCFHWDSEVCVTLILFSQTLRSESVGYVTDNMTVVQSGWGIKLFAKWMRRIDTCTCLAESLRSLPETITTLLIGYACMLCRFSHVWHLAILQAPLFMAFSRQEYQSQLPCPSPGDLPDQGLELVSLCLLHCSQFLYYLSYRVSCMTVMSVLNWI